MTFEDVKRIRQNPTAEDIDNQELHKMIDLAIEKQIPIKLYSWNCTIREDFYKVECPECLGSHITRIRPDYCMECGQRFDWSEIDELLNKE